MKVCTPTKLSGDADNCWYRTILQTEILQTVLKDLGLVEQRGAN